MDELTSMVESALEKEGISGYRLGGTDGRLLVILRRREDVEKLIRSLSKIGLKATYGDPVPDYYEWKAQVDRDEIYVPDDLNEIADNLWKLREDIDEWKLVVNVPDEVMDLLLLGDRREIFFQLKKWGWDRRLEVVYFVEWFETYYGLLDFWREAIENMGANPFGRNYLVKVEYAPSESAQE